MNSPIYQQDAVESSLYLLQDYDCISPGHVQYGTWVLYHKMVPYGAGPYGMRYFVYEFFFTIFQRRPTPVARGCRPLLIAYHRCSHLQATRLVINLPAPTILCYLFQLVIFNFLSRSILISLPPEMYRHPCCIIKHASPKHEAAEVFRVSEAVI